MLKDRYDELNSGHGEPVECEKAFARLKAKNYDPERQRLNLSARKGEDSQAALRITTLTLAPEGSDRPHASGF